MKIDSIEKIINITRMPWENTGDNAVKADGHEISLDTLKIEPMQLKPFRDMHVTGIEVDISMRPAEWGEPTPSTISWEQNYSTRIKDECEDAMWGNYWGTDEMEYISFSPQFATTGLVQIHSGEPFFIKHAEDVRETFVSVYESILNEIKNGFAHGLFSEAEYNNRLDGLNKAYDKNHLYAYYGLSFTQGFGIFEMALNDIKSRYANGDFGEGEGVYEARLEAWSMYFDIEATGASRYFEDALSFMTSGYFESDSKSSPQLESLYLKGKAQFRSDIERLYHNARDYLLAGNSAATLTDAILNEGLNELTVDDLRFIHSKEFSDIYQLVLKQNLSEGDRTKTQSQDKQEWENLFAYLKEQFSKNESLSDALKKAFLNRFEFGAEFFPLFYKSNFIVG